jgi:hypothetical protein
MPVPSQIGTGLATRTIWEIGARAWARVSGWRYKRVFGRDAFNGDLHLTYGLLVPPEAINAQGKKVIHIFSKLSKKGMSFSVSRIVSICEVRALTYIAESVALNTKSWVKLSSDEDLQSKIDISLISLGIMNNDKTGDMLRNPGNAFVDFPVDRFVSKLQGRVIVPPSKDPKCDYGMNLKVHPISAPERNWICCGGYGEWGTSGAAWYLAHRWRYIYKKFGQGPFVIFVRVEVGRDESAVEFISAASPQELDRQIP